MAELIIVTGEPGVGKSFVAQEINDRAGKSMVLATDEIRNELFDDPQHDNRESHITYDEMFYRGRVALQNGYSVVMDATFSLKIGRERAEHIANFYDAEFTIVRVHCNQWSELRSRLEARPEDGAGIDVHKQIADRFEPIYRDRVDIFTHVSKEETINQIEEKL